MIKFCHFSDNFLSSLRKSLTKLVSAARQSDSAVKIRSLALLSEAAFTLGIKTKQDGEQDGESPQ